MGTLTGLRGFNAIYGLWKTDRRERGLSGPPNDFYEVRGDASTEMDYEQFCSALEAAGVNWLRVKLVGWNNPIGSVACSFEPPPYGTFNLWQSALDPTNLVQYRADQFAPPYPPTVWLDSNVGQFVLAAERHGVKLHVILFDNVEFERGWWLHAWNSANRYIDGTPCQAQDQGFIANAADAFVDSRALAAAYERVDAALALFDGHEEVVGAWEIMAEQAWITAPDFIGTTWGSPAHVQHIHNLRDWNEVLCRYIQARHPAPVGVSNAPANAIRRDSIRIEIFDAPSLDWIGLNWYDEARASPVEAHDFLRDAQARWPGKQMVVQQYHPAGPDTVPNEAAPWRLSKSFEWVIACGERGMCGGQRWPDIQFGTYASPWLREIAGVTATMAGDAQLGAWAGGRSWDGNVQSADLSLASTWGDGRHVSAFLQWSAAAPHQVVVNGLQDGEYRVRWYDWLVGDFVTESVGIAAGGTLNVGRAVVRENTAALLVIPAMGPSSSASSSVSPSASSSTSPSASASSSESGSTSSSASSSESRSESGSASASDAPVVTVRLVVEDDTGVVDVLNLEEGRDYVLRVEVE